MINVFGHHKLVFSLATTGPSCKVQPGIWQKFSYVVDIQNKQVLRNFIISCKKLFFARNCFNLHWQLQKSLLMSSDNTCSEFFFGQDIETEELYCPRFHLEIWREIRTSIWRMTNPIPSKKESTLLDHFKSR